MYYQTHPKQEKYLNQVGLNYIILLGASLNAYPEKEKLYEHNCDQYCTCQFKTPATDLINQLQDHQKSLASKLTEASIQRYDDKLELVRNTAAMGMTKDTRVVQNLALTLNKVITSPLAVEFDKEENKNTLNLLVLVLQYWVTEHIDKDQIVLLNTMQILECLNKSWTFTSAFKKQREAMEKLEKMAQDPQMAPSDRNQVFRVVSQISSTIDIQTIPHYNKAHFHNWTAIDEICKPDGNIISRSYHYKEPLHHTQLEPNGSKSKKHRGGAYLSIDNTQSTMMRSSQSTANLLPSIKHPLQHSGAMQFTQVNSPIHKHDPCYFSNQEQQQTKPYTTERKQNLTLDKTGSYLINPYKVTFLKGNYPSLEKLPPIQMTYSGDLLKDYCTMLNPEINQRDVVVFALHSIDNMGMSKIHIIILLDAIRDIMNDKYLFLLSFLLFEYHNFPSEISQSQFRVCERLVDQITSKNIFNDIIEHRSIDLLGNNGINRMLKNFKFQNSNMKKLIVDLLYKVLTYTREIIDIPMLVNLTMFPNQEIRNAGIKTICEISDPADLEGNLKKAKQDRIDITFHIHIPYLIQLCTTSPSPSNQTFRNYALQTLANLANRDYLKSYITFNKGLELFLDILLSKDSSNLAGKRIAAKAITTMAQGNSEMKVKLMTSLKKEIKDAWDGTGDAVISAYLKKMLKEGINFDT